MDSEALDSDQPQYRALSSAAVAALVLGSVVARRVL